VLKCLARDKGISMNVNGDTTIQLTGIWHIRVRHGIPELWEGAELLGWWSQKTTATLDTESTHFVLHPEKEIPKKILTSFKLYCLNKALH